MSFTKATLETAMNNLAKAGKIFSNESQFQFDLVWELREMGYDVELEVLSADCAPSEFSKLEKKERKKYYTDIIIRDDENYIAIELKYKTPDKGVMLYTTNIGNYYVFPQGAENISSYLYWKDVERLESLVHKKVPLNFDSNKKVYKGYAVLLTNDKKYWDVKCYDPCSLAREFFPFDGRQVENEKLCWHVKLDGLSGKVMDGRKARKNGIGFIDERVDTEAAAKTYYKEKVEEHYPIEIKGNYQCDWKDFDCGITKVSGIDKTGKQMPKNISDYSFSYLLLEV